MGLLLVSLTVSPSVTPLPTLPLPLPPPLESSLRSNIAYGNEDPPELLTPPLPPPMSAIGVPPNCATNSIENFSSASDILLPLNPDWSAGSPLPPPPMVYPPRLGSPKAGLGTTQMVNSVLTATSRTKDGGTHWYVVPAMV